MKNALKINNLLQNRISSEALKRENDFKLVFTKANKNYKNFAAQ